MKPPRLYLLSSLLVTVLTTPAKPRHASQSTLSSLALTQILDDATPIFGPYAESSATTATWMKGYHDSTPIAHMNIPGTHDSSTWNYSQATQDALRGITNLAGLKLNPPSYYRCQDLPFISQLNGGIRVFDLRFALDVTNTTLVLYHGAALQSQTATLEDVLFGFYNWLDKYQSEAVFLSFQYEGGTQATAQNDAQVQLNMFNLLTSRAAKKYILQAKGSFGTLGDARGKATILRRFDLDQLPATYEAALPGIHFSPQLWTDNSPNISLTYNATTGAAAYIEDLYEPDAPIGSTASNNIKYKYNATTANILRATNTNPDSLFWSFASSTYLSNTPVDTPRIMALGNGTLTPDGGVNHQLLPFLKSQNGKRMGIVMFDYFDTPSGLVEALLGL